jgi:glyoxylase-like metal-dependent hydrolase (beta-lactamase superfamily II)
VAQIAPQAWVGRFGPSNCAWLDLGDGVLVIDTGASKADAERLISQIAKTTNGKAVKWIVLTHLHGHANSGLPSFLPTGATIFVHPAVASGVAEKLAAAAPGSAKANVVGVAKPQTVGSGKNRVEISSPGARAATGQDLWAFLPDSALAFVGDLVVPGRCPNMTDPEADPDAWIRTLAEIAGRKPNILAGSGGDVSHQAVEDLETTKSYVSRIVGTAREFKAKGYPESRLPAELNLLKKVGDYCPTTIDLPNGQAIFRRMGSDGTVKPMRRP